MTDTALPITVGRAGGFDELARLFEIAFHTTLPAETREAERSIWEPQRSLLVFDGADLVASAGAYTRELTVPGAVVPAAHVTMVAVLPTHRRRGLLTRLMRRQLREVRDAGREPVAVLWASEGRIYPRFGYGLAAQQLAVECTTTELRL
ncbi:GNAT family N-acetyltransferase, partial [Micromonospora sp. DH15]|nr:GNAT family N-acetyltransferase [Micromonospora sp. DH15]